MFKKLTEFCSKIKNFKIPYLFKSPLHDNFHCTGDQIYIRIISELMAKGAKKNEIIERLSGQKISEFSEHDINAYEVWIDKMISRINQQDEAFCRVIPSLFPQKYYRGVFESSEITTLKKGDVYTDYGYSWFTPQKSYAEDFSRGKDGVIVETVIPFGAKISRDVEVSLFDGCTGLNPFTSMNVVVPRNTRYEVLKTFVKDGKMHVRVKYLGV